MKMNYSDGTLTVALTGELDHHSAAYLRNRIDRDLLQNRPDRLVLDFSAVTFMDSSGVGLVLGRYKKAGEMNCTVSVSGLNERDGRMMKLAGLQKLIEFR